jgi:AcrR family transcriptional regulator
MDMTAQKSKSSPKSAARSAKRESRTDGAATRARIIEAAGQLFAEHGYADTTSKAICERAETNIAAVNYHFGSRDGLYQALLEEVHRRVVGLDFLKDLAEGSLAPEEKLGVLLEELLPLIVTGQGWPVRLWARELLSPSPLLPRIMRGQIMPKFMVLMKIVSEVTGIDLDDPALPRCILNIMAPCMLLLLARRDLESPIRQVLKQPVPELVAHMKIYAQAGLKAVAAQRRK